MPAKFQYIPGKVNNKTGKQIPWMSKGLGDASFRAGVRARMLGFEAVKRNLNIILGKVNINAFEGLVAFTHILYADMQTTSPTIPEKTGELLKSWDYKGFNLETINVGKMGPFPDAVEVGFYAPYAIYVHEMTDDAYGKKINWTKPGSGAKFFQYALQRNAKRLLIEVGIKTKIGA